jgi:hypothetical protein
MASCKGLTEQKTTNWWTLRMAALRSAGAKAKPIYQPVRL